MRLSMHAVWSVVVLLVPAITEGADQKPAETLAAIKAACSELDNGQKPGTTDADKKKWLEHYYKSVGDLGRRAVVLAKRYPDSPEAVEALVWAHLATTEDDPELAGLIYDMLAERYLDSDAILPLCHIAWADVNKATHTPKTEEFLRAAVERSKNVKVRSLCCYSLGRHQQELASKVRDLLFDPVRGEIILRHLGASVRAWTGDSARSILISSNRRPKSALIARSRSSVISSRWARTSRR
jgi:hypothetical protein